MNEEKTNPTPLVSVVMACYNSERYLRPAIDSVLGQTYRNLELVVVDDCSSDGTVSIVRDYATRDERVRLIQRTERGGRPAVTKNTALQHLNGKYVCFLDHDDYYGPDKIATQVALLEAHPDCVAAFHDVDLVNADGGLIERYLGGFPADARNYLSALAPDVYLCRPDFFVFQSIHYAAIHTISVMIARERISAGCLRFDTRFKVCDDTDLWVRLGLEGQMIYVHRSLAFYRQHATNITVDKSKSLEDAILCITENVHRMKGRMAADDYKVLKTRLADYLSDAGWMYRNKSLSLKSFAAYLAAWRWSLAPKHLVHACKAFFAPRSS